MSFARIKDFTFEDIISYNKTTHDHVYRIGCLNCGEIIESKSRNDFRTCGCGKIAIDGGRDYVKVSANIEDFDVIWGKIKIKSIES